jgi:hypothetical protein
VSDVYSLPADKLRQACLERGFDSGGSVRSLRLRLSQHIYASKMQLFQGIVRRIRYQS